MMGSKKNEAAEFFEARLQLIATDDERCGGIGVWLNSAAFSQPPTGAKGLHSQGLSFLYLEE
ncbi:hypothetical protein EBB07_08490 [Paenibacillaceae bacterium]|nr:hypothetical protein EBB07_08490 [Paenibacillaceae bacterium]